MLQCSIGITYLGYLGIFVPGISIQYINPPVLCTFPSSISIFVVSQQLCFTLNTCNQLLAIPYKGMLASFHFIISLCCFNSLTMHEPPALFTVWQYPGLPRKSHECSLATSSIPDPTACSHSVPFAPNTLVASHAPMTVSPVTPLVRLSMALRPVPFWHLTHP